MLYDTTPVRGDALAPVVYGVERRSSDAEITTRPIVGDEATSGVNLNLSMVGTVDGGLILEGGGDDGSFDSAAGVSFYFRNGKLVQVDDTDAAGNTGLGPPSNPPVTMTLLWNGLGA